MGTFGRSFMWSGSVLTIDVIWRQTSCDQRRTTDRPANRHLSTLSCKEEVAFSQKYHKVNRRNLACTVQLGPPRGTESDNIYWFKTGTKLKIP